MTVSQSTSGSVGDPNGYGVRVVEARRGWEVHIIDPRGEVAEFRPCRDEAEARTFASTVKQHVYWLSPARFRQYYRLPEPG